MATLADTFLADLEDLSDASDQEEEQHDKGGDVEVHTAVEFAAEDPCVALSLQHRLRTSLRLMLVLKKLSPAAFTI